MKTIKYLTMAVAALMMAACSNEELDSAASKTGSRIALEIVPTVQGQTRANQLTNSNLTEFKVSVTGTFCEDDGTEITNPVLTLSKTGGNWSYTYLVGADVHNGPLYWPREAVNATFSAYTHDAGAVDESTEHQTDIIGGWATKSFDGTTDPGEVALSMQHAVAKMQFKALVQGETTDAQKVKIDIKQVAVRNMGYAGTYAIPTSTVDNKGELTLSTTADPATTDIVAVSASKGTFIEVGATAATDLASFFMIPQDITAQDLSAANPWSSSYISVLAQVRVVQGGNETRIFPAGTNATDASYAWIALPMPTEFTGMVAHKKYIFTLNFSTDGIGKVDYDQQPDDTDTEPATDPGENIDPNDEGKDIVLPGKSGNRVVVTVEEVNDFEEEGNIDINNNTSAGGGGTAAPEAVDLGLPSGTKWANMNVGATSEEEYGDFFAWGETTGYTSSTEGKEYYDEWRAYLDYTDHNFDWANYKWNPSGDGETFTRYNYAGEDYESYLLLAEDDAATANWGSSWRMPTDIEIIELVTNTIWELGQLNGVNGFYFYKKNGNEKVADTYIFLPAAGYRRETILSNQGVAGCYWSKTMHLGSKDAYILGFFSDEVMIPVDISFRYRGCSVRPVRAN